MRLIPVILVLLLLVACSREKTPVTKAPVPPEMPAVADASQIARSPSGLAIFIPTQTPYTGVLKEWDEDRVTEYEITFKDGLALSRKVVSNTSLTLNDKERKYLWDTEHQGTLLRKFGIKPLVDALEARDGEAIAKQLSATFQGLVPATEAQVQRSVLGMGTANRWELAEGNRKMLDRNGFIPGGELVVHEVVVIRWEDVADTCRYITATSVPT